MLSARIRARMDELDMTNEKLSEISNVSIGTVNHIVSGQTPNPKISTLVPLSKALNMTLDEMAGLMIETDLPVQESPAIAAYQGMIDNAQTTYQEHVNQLDAKHRMEIELLSKSHNNHVRELEHQHQIIMNMAGKVIFRQFWVLVVMSVVICALVAHNFIL